jgi:hypothetical protein
MLTWLGIWECYSPGHTLFGDNSGDTTERALEFRRNGSLRAHFDRLEWTQSYIGDELGRSTGCQVQGGLPTVGILLANEVAVEALEELVASIFKCTLGLCLLSQYRKSAHKVW